MSVEFEKESFPPFLVASKSLKRFLHETKREQCSCKTTLSQTMTPQQVMILSFPQTQNKKRTIMPPQSDFGNRATRDWVDDSEVDSCKARKTCPQSSPKSTRSVGFVETPNVHAIPHHSEMSKEEINEVWMNRYDMKQTKMAVNSTVFLMKSGVGALLTEADDFCQRGLEHLLDEKYAYRVKKSQGIALAMQRFLRRNGAKNPEMIAKAYTAYTVASRDAAHKLALDDQKECICLLET
jgi:hypothetical protein